VEGGRLIPFDFEATIEIPVRVTGSFTHLGIPATRDGLEPPEGPDLCRFAVSVIEEIPPLLNGWTGPRIEKYLTKEIKDELIDRAVEEARGEG